MNENPMSCSERQREAIEKLKIEKSEAALWETVVAFCGENFLTSSGLPFCYTLKVGRNGEFTKELWIDRRENSKSLSWSSVVLAFKNALEMSGEIIPGPKSLGNIRGVSYIYPLLWKFGVISVPVSIELKMHGC